ncbi:hypothetical protein Ddye_016675 [Dipteronia dyeriana]|uniref:RNase H type-1 domain-containing protein n=1 Tax=Dipteronia dyeriana TaxID=168575 RepID=A0AAD9WZT6_9ROSI|nr:hypothetical protein Ddye_016675 [Dipteronia dyeriana]
MMLLLMSIGIELVLVLSFVIQGSSYGFMCSGFFGEFFSSCVGSISYPAWPCVVESDSQTAVSMINSGNAPLSDTWLIIEDILDILKGHLKCTVNFVSRKANMAVHCLAKLGFMSDCDRF